MRTDLFSSDLGKVFRLVELSPKALVIFSTEILETIRGKRL